MARRIPTVVDRIAWKGPQNAGDFRVPQVADHAHAEDHAARALLHPLSRRARQYQPRRLSRSRCVLVRPGRSLHPGDAVAGGRGLHAICRSTRPRWSSSAIRGCGNCSSERGDDWRDLLRSYIAAVNAVVAGAPEGNDHRHPRLPQPGPELAGRCRLRSDRRVAVQRDEGRHLFSRIRQCARRNV